MSSRVRSIGFLRRPGIAGGSRSEATSKRLLSSRLRTRITRYPLCWKIVQMNHRFLRAMLDGLSAPLTAPALWRIHGSQPMQMYQTSAMDSPPSGQGPICLFGEGRVILARRTPDGGMTRRRIPGVTFRGMVRPPDDLATRLSGQEAG